MNQRNKTILFVGFLIATNLSLAMYDTNTGRFMQQDPLGTQPAANAKINSFKPEKQYSDGMNVYEYVASGPSKRTDPLGTFFMVPPSIPKQKNCGIWTLYAKHSTRGGLQRIRGCTRKGPAYTKYLYSIERLNLNIVSRKMKRNCCDCFDFLRIKDHGKVKRYPYPRGDIPKQGYGWVASAHWLGSNDVKNLCPYLCKNSTLKLMGCDVGFGDRKNFQFIFDACPKIKDIIACRGKVKKVSEKCHSMTGLWTIFKR